MQIITYFKQVSETLINSINIILVLFGAAYILDKSINKSLLWCIKIDIEETLYKEDLD